MSPLQPRSQGGAGHSTLQSTPLDVVGREKKFLFSEFYHLANLNEMKHYEDLVAIILPVEPSLQLADYDICRAGDTPPLLPLTPRHHVIQLTRPLLR